MKHYHSLEEANLKNSYLTIGVFDGVHRGHRQIITKLVDDAHAKNSPAVVLTFDPHPASVLTGKEIRLLTTPDERALILDSLDVDVVITQRFTRDLSTATAFEYMSSLKQTVGLSHLLIGYDFALGKGREGNAPRLTEIGKELNYTVEVIPALSDESGVISSTEIRKLISSTEIRKLISVGNVSEATKLLGYEYPLGGIVIHGAGRGKQINFPTANIDYPQGKATPSNGIYACWATLGEEKFMAATSVGFNPTFTPERQIQSVEAYLLDFDRDIYDQYLKLEFVSRIRDEVKFESVEALIQQIGKDVEETRKILENNV
ncbi:MAG TPA: bifunctional riboflavin kinase/FMN adenylyltransferase [Anaerolineae bacterium]|nr:bifunctional riboflavin kinase/FMN adenylyltransferase [Anaerolineae bacterium]HCK66553.1 bifunctional riboflavin kinase/FMN adenylyltransferase [Anaerolineae bacterium]